MHCLRSSITFSILVLSLAAVSSAYVAGTASEPLAQLKGNEDMQHRIDLFRPKRAAQFGMMPVQNLVEYIRQEPSFVDDQVLAGMYQGARRVGEQVPVSRLLVKEPDVAPEPRQLPRINVGLLWRPLVNFSAMNGVNKH
ncbi:hypothetical protein AAVH_29946 [Aphelenchoides avenae]|nr:hypothetical protein AAVH_29946 [Aphelenchus avenae]